MSFKTLQTIYIWGFFLSPCALAQAVPGGPESCPVFFAALSQGKNIANDSIEVSLQKIQNHNTSWREEDILFREPAKNVTSSNVGGLEKIYATKVKWEISFGDYTNAAPKPPPPKPLLKKVLGIFKKEPQPLPSPLATFVQSDTARVFTGTIDAKILASKNNVLFEAKHTMKHYIESDASWQPDYLLLNTGIRINAASLQPDVVYTLSIKSNHTFSADFKVSKNLTDVYIPFSQFRSNSAKAQSLIETIEKNTLYYDTEMAIQVLKDRQKIPFVPGQKFALEIGDNIEFERDLRNSTLFNNLTKKSRNSLGPEQINPALVGPYDYIKRLDIEKPLIQKVINNLYSPENQNYALEIARKGETAILARLKELGATPYYLSGPVETNTFFNNGGIMAMHLRGIPVEKSDFGNVHSVWAHGLQVIAMTKDLSPKELKEFWYIYNSQFGHQSGGWAFWDTLFDAPGHQLPNAPHFWKHKLNSLGIPESIQLSPGMVPEDPTKYYPAKGVGG